MRHTHHAYSLMDRPEKEQSSDLGLLQVLRSRLRFSNVMDKYEVNCLSEDTE